MRYALFPGCMIPLRLPHIERSTRMALEALGIEILDMKGASCCGEPISIQSLDRMAWLTLAARNLCIAEEMNTDILTICSGCYETLKTANFSLRRDPNLRKRINEKLSAIGKEFKGTIEVRNLIEVLRNFGQDKVKAHLKRPLKGLRVATHPGCHLLRPSDIIQFDDPMRPVILDRFTELLGAKSIQYPKKMLCCGAGLRLVDLDKANKLVETKLSLIESSEADCIVVVCPYCMIQYDLTQRMIKREGKAAFNIPVLYYSELLSLALGFSPSEIGLRFHRTSVEPLLERLS
ncbi:MAG: CoB--CoM heterodisulfide reductase iron-sulfur subunit B family protein [Candidatus Bathyarchaeia archaeon]|nr:CoB--CoM heterodisulfide reductase subunit B [Candidatus Bathyarchaeota archaeon]